MSGQWSVGSGQYFLIDLSGPRIYNNVNLFKLASAFSDHWPLTTGH